MENTNDQLVTPKIFELAKKKGYIHSKLSLYIMPSQSYLQRWLREKQNISVDVKGYLIKKHHLGYEVYVYDVARWDSKTYNDENHYTYEQALEKGLEQGLKVCPNCL